MQWFSALIPAYPRIQARAHEELDRVVGRDRLPAVGDEKNLPYIHAIIKVTVEVNCELSKTLTTDDRKSKDVTTPSGSGPPTSTQQISLTAVNSSQRTRYWY